MNSITYIVTDKCNISCDFCAPGCAPKYKKYLNSQSMIKVFSDVNAQMIVPLVVFTGGEPMLFKKDVISTIEYIKKESPQTIIRIVSNGFWASTLKSAKDTIMKLKISGISELNISVDDFHQEFIPEKNIKNAVLAATELKIRILLAHKTYPNSISNKNYYEKLLGIEIVEVNKTDKNNFSEGDVLFSKGYTVPIGRGEENVDKENWIPDNYSDKRWKGPCSEVLKSYTISPDGSLMPCCGLISRDLGVFYAGDVIKNNVTDEMEKYSKSFLYNWLALEGPSSIMEYIKEKDSSIKFSDKFVQNCQICQELFSNEKVLYIISENMDEISLQLSMLRCVLDARRTTLMETIKNTQNNETMHAMPS